MTIGLFNSYTNVVVVPEFGVSSRVVDSDVGLYVCPADKKAMIKKVSMIIDALGGDATYAVAVKRGTEFFPIGKFVNANAEQESNGSTLLDAGDRITNIGDSGSKNGTIDMDAIIQEVDV